jgi:hypothetical protein
MAANDEPFEVAPDKGDTLFLHYYPDNVLHTFTFLIKDVEGVENISQIRGAISGVSGSYFPATGKQATRPSTLLFDGIAIHTNGNVTGQFTTFGFVDFNTIYNRLTIEILSDANRYYYATWGYWDGKWDRHVTEQLKGAWGTSGSLEEQMTWREHNGGYDIILSNDGRLSVPYEPPAQGSNNSGFIIETSDWDNVVVPIG